MNSPQRKITGPRPMGSRSPQPQSPLQHSDTVVRRKPIAGKSYVTGIKLGNMTNNHDRRRRVSTELSQQSRFRDFLGEQSQAQHGTRHHQKNSSRKLGQK
jgi:hypothetical protein